MPLRILLVEDDLDIAAGIGDYLAAHGIGVDFAYDAAEARTRLRANRFDLLVLDVNLPGEDGMALCRELKQVWRIRQPVIFLTARGSLDDKLTGFAAGAADYVVKPFEPAELLARIRALAVHAAAGGAQLRVGDYVLDVERALLSRGNVQLPLHAAWLTILRGLMQAYPGSASRRALGEDLWDGAVPDSDPLRAHVHQLRAAMRACFGEAPIATLRGVGYRFGADE